MLDNPEPLGPPKNRDVTRNMTRPARAVRASLSEQMAPALSFTAYDVVDWPDVGLRWLDLVGKQPDAPVCLGRTSTDEQRGALVYTRPKAGYGGHHPLEADRGPIGLFQDVIEPTVTPRNHKSIGQSLRAYLAYRVADFSLWPKETWTVDGHEAQAVHASVLRFAGAWLGLVELDESYVAVIGVGGDPGHIALVQEDGGGVGHDFAAPITLGQLRGGALGRMPRPNQHGEPHPDLEPFLRGLPVHEDVPPNFKHLCSELNRTAARGHAEAVRRGMRFYVPSVVRRGNDVFVEVRYVAPGFPRVILRLALVDGYGRTVDYDQFGTHLMAYVSTYVAAHPAVTAARENDTAIVEAVEMFAGDYFGGGRPELRNPPEHRGFGIG